MAKEYGREAIRDEAWNLESRASNLAKKLGKDYFKGSTNIAREVSDLYKEAAKLYDKIGDSKKMRELSKLSKSYEENIIKGYNQMFSGFHGKKSRFKNVEWNTFAFLSITSLAFALIFISLNLTGNAIGGITLNDSRWISICFFLCGLLFAFFYLRNKK
ncbi:MAG: hypothetical protein PHQ66_00675 [Candidatus Nanoarchaeia archaeon]|nr:hypothetical protein [Candidatus Nanoarchaeia archaeon]MDD5358508.1 hypothetical protein [Candidatus Nanoarchaeia archaeon]MDD5589022.1 hypothetical protein [Candidatus Nanoarchaeia archaeon]